MFICSKNYFPSRWKCHHSNAELHGHQENHLCCLQCQNGISKLCEVRKIVFMLQVILKLFLKFCKWERSRWQLYWTKLLRGILSEICAFVNLTHVMQLYQIVEILGTISKNAQTTDYVLKLTSKKQFFIENLKIEQLIFKFVEENWVRCPAFLQW